MDFSREPFVRIYTTVSPSGRLHGFFGRALLEALIKTADSTGVIALPENLISDLPTAVAAAIDCPDPEWVREHLPKLTKEPDPSVLLKQARLEDGKMGHFVVIPRYCDAQYARICPTFSGKMSKRKTREQNKNISLGLIDSGLSKTA